jgi:lysophospholipase-3
MVGVVIVPGDGSNQLFARLDKRESAHWWCTRRSDWFRIWLSLSSLLNPLELPCWCENMRLDFNASTGRMQSAAGVHVRVSSFGSTRSFEQLDPDVPAAATAVWQQMVDALERAGHARDTDVRGAPYDFRFSPLTDTGYHRALEALIEQTSRAHGKAPVVLLSHSLGCLHLQAFLAARSAAWKAQYVREWIAIAGPYGGAASEVRLHASGDNVGLPISSLALRGQQRSYESNVWMLPNPRVWGCAPLARTAERTYSSLELEQFLRDVGYAEGALVLRALGPLRAGFDRAPGVRVRCLFSTGVPTAESFNWTGSTASRFDSPPLVELGDGDGTVGERSLRVCTQWAQQQAEPVIVQRFVGISHSAMLTAKPVVDYVVAAVEAAER